MQSKYAIGEFKMDETKETIYGEHLENLKTVLGHLVKIIEEGADKIMEKTGMEPIEHLKARVKTDESMREKCRREGLPETTESALEKLHDAIGIRIVCPFLDDVYFIRDWITSIEGVEIVQEKDYIRNVKPNGYRSLHMITRFEGYYAEFQIRTISMDTWAALEHHIKYKKKIRGNTKLIFDELKRCADELASTDASMQTIRSMIYEEI